MDEQFSRLAFLIGEEKVRYLQKCKVAVFGLGGVGGITAEALARSGVGHLVLVDSDTVSVSNLNRQILALHQNMGQKKIDVMKDRLLQINPGLKLTLFSCFYLPGNQDNILSGCHYVADAIDTVSGKLALIEQARECGVPIISCMGTGNKLNPSLLQVSDISKTSVCPLARVMRRELKKRGIDRVKVVYSQEELVPHQNASGERKSVPGSFMPVTASAGLLMASDIRKDLIKF